MIPSGPGLGTGALPINMNFLIALLAGSPEGVNLLDAVTDGPLTCICLAQCQFTGCRCTATQNVKSKPSCTHANILKRQKIQGSNLIA